MREIYHVIPKAKWDQVSHETEYRPESLEREGFIHCSLSSQCEGVIERYFKNEEELLILAIDPAQLRSELKYEGLNEHFPHVYGPIERSAIVAVVPWQEFKRLTIPPSC